MNGMVPMSMMDGAMMKERQAPADKAMMAMGDGMACIGEKIDQAAASSSAASQKIADAIGMAACAVGCASEKISADAAARSEEIRRAAAVIAATIAQRVSCRMTVNRGGNGLIESIDVRPIVGE